MAAIMTAVAAFIKAYSVYITLASMAYQIVQARKMKKAAKEAAEARKGYEMVVEGEAVTLPIVYGRAKVGGVRTYHNVSSNFNYVTPNSDKNFIAGLTSNQTGSKNEFLYFQQAICQGPINSVKDIVFEDAKYINDPDLGNVTTINTYVYDENLGEQLTGAYDKVNAGFRVDVHYGETAVADAILTANFSERSDSTFNELAYSSVVIKLDRDKPQFNNVPPLQFFIEGKKVFTYANGNKSAQRVYTNNPAWCLLDYLVDTKNLNISEIDVSSFEHAAQICNTIVQTDAVVGGKIFQSTDGQTNVLKRDIPLYECNILIDTQKPIRENVEAILATMGDARLVWSGGKYKLNLQYPASNNNIILAAELTDDDLVVDDSVDINWPTASERLNYCTVRFHNESENFKEDTVSWPPKTSGTYLKGIGGFKYPTRGGWGSNPGETFLNSYAVWSGAASNSTLTYKVAPRESGNFLLEYTGDDYIQVLVKQGTTTIFDSGSQGDLGSIKNTTLALTANTVYTIILLGADTGGLEGMAAKLSKDNFVIWTTRSDSFSNFINVTVSDEIYQTMKTEDGDLELETDIFADGITDYYHALAKAEELVRTSRSAFGLKFKYIIKDNFLEPGDIISINSSTLNLGVDAGNKLYLRVNQVKIGDESTCEVTGTRFDYTQLAWNQKDDEYLKPANIYDTYTYPVTYVNYIEESNDILSSSGRLEWSSAIDPSFSSYIIYMYVEGNLDNNGARIFNEIGRSSENFFVLPALTVNKAIFGVRVLSKTGKLSALTTNSDTPVVITLTSKYVNITPDGLAFTKKTDDTLAPATIQLATTIEGFRSPVYKWYVDDVLTNVVSSTYTINAFTGVSSKKFRVIVQEQSNPSIFVEDTQFIYSLVEGAPAYTIALSNDSINLTADPVGVPVTGQLPKEVAIYVAKGATVLTTGVDYNIATTGCTATVNTQGLITITEVDDPFAVIEVTANVFAIGLTLNKTLTISKANAGADGSNYPIARISAPRLAFVTPKNTTTALPSSITLTSVSTGFLNPSYEWYVDDVLQGVTTGSFVLDSFAANNAKKVTLYVEETADPLINSEDNLTIYSIAEGSDAYVMTLTDENRTIPADKDGNPIVDYLPFTTNAVVVRGIDVITSNSDIFYSLSNADNVSATINPTTGLVTVSDITASSGSIKVNASIPGGPTLTKILTVSLAVAGEQGRDAATLVLNTSGNLFLYDSSTATTSSSPAITLTVVLANTTGDSVFTATAYDTNDTSLGTVALTGFGNTRSLSSTSFNSQGLTTTRYVKVTATLGALSDTTSIYRSNNGANGKDALTVLLTNESHTLPADQYGNVSSYTGASTVIKVYEGLTDVSSLWSFSKVDSAGLTTSLTGVGTSLPTLSVSSLTSSYDSATSSITATRTNYATLTKVFSLSKSKAGAQGATGATGATGSSGSDGATGSRGATVLSVSSSSSDPGTGDQYTWSTIGTTIQTALNSMFSTYTDRQPKLYDRATVYNSSSKWSRTYQYNGSLWSYITLYVDGNAVITGTLSASALNSGTAGVAVYNVNGQYVSGQFKLGSGDRTPIGNTAAIGTFTCSTNTGWALMGVNTNTSYGEWGNGILAATSSPGGAGLGAYTVSYSSTSVTNLKSASIVAETGAGAYAIYTKSGSWYQTSYQNNLDVSYRRCLGGLAYPNYGLRGEAYGNGTNLSAGGQTGLSTTIGEIAYCSDDQTQSYSALFVRRHVSGGSYGQEAGRVVLTPSWAPTRAIEISGGGSYTAQSAWIPGGVAPFTGSHEGQNDQEFEIGDIVIDGQMLFKQDVSNVFSEVVLSTTAKDKRVFGVVAFSYENKPVELIPDNDENGMVAQGYTPSTVEVAKEVEPWKLKFTIMVNGVGEGQVNVCGQNGNIEAGDLIVTSTIPGKGMKQDDDLIRSYTVAKARESVSFNSPDEVKMIACTYLCG